MWLLGVFLFLLLGTQAAQAQPNDAVVVSMQGLVGVTKTLPGKRVVIYYVELQDADSGPGVTAQLGLPGTNLGIQVTISDLSTPTGISSSDITSLELHRSSDVTFDAGDIFIDSVTPTIGAVSELDATGAIPADRLLPVTPSSIYFLITAVISPTATLGTAFRLGAVAGHIGIDESGLAGVDGVLGSTIAASDANNVTIGDIATGASGPVAIPFGGEVAMLLFLVTSGIYALRRA